MASLQHREAQYLGVSLGGDLRDDRGQLVGCRGGHTDGEVEIRLESDREGAAGAATCR
jgi:hypothetical protein